MMRKFDGTRILIATHNAGKLEEMRALLRFGPRLRLSFSALLYCLNLTEAARIYNFMSKPHGSVAILTTLWVWTVYPSSLLSLQPL